MSSKQSFFLDYESWCTANGYDFDGIARYVIDIEMLIINYSASRRRFEEMLLRFDETVKRQSENAIDNLWRKMLRMFLEDRPSPSPNIIPQGGGQIPAIVIQSPAITVDEQLTLSYVLLANVHDTVEYFAPISPIPLVPPAVFMPFSKWGEFIRYYASPYLKGIIRVAMSRVEADLKSGMLPQPDGAGVSRMKKRGGSRPKYDAIKDDKLVRDLDASGLKIKEFALKRGLKFKDVKAAKDRHRKRQF